MRTIQIHTLGVLEVNDGSVVLEQVDLINSGDSGNTQSLEGGLQFLVVSDGLLVDNLYKIIRF